MAQNPRFKAKPFATQEEVQALNQHIHEHLQGIDTAMAGLNRVQAIFEQALIKTMQDIESLSDVLVEVGILTDDEIAVGAPEEEVEEERPGVGYPEFFDDADPNVQDAVERFDRAFSEAEDGVQAEVDAHAGDRASGEGMPDAPSKEERQAAVRAKRMAFVEHEGLKAFEEANEGTPAELDNDPNSVQDVPEEGIVVLPGRDPFTGEPTSNDS